MGYICVCQPDLVTSHIKAVPNKMGQDGFNHIIYRAVLPIKWDTVHMRVPSALIMMSASMSV